MVVGLAPASLHSLTDFTAGRQERRSICASTIRWLLYCNVTVNDFDAFISLDWYILFLLVSFSVIYRPHHNSFTFDHTLFFFRRSRSVFSRRYRFRFWNASISRYTRIVAIPQSSRGAIHSIDIARFNRLPLFVWTGDWRPTRHSLFFCVKDYPLITQYFLPFARQWMRGTRRPWIQSLHVARWLDWPFSGI